MSKKSFTEKIAKVAQKFVEAWNQNDEPNDNFMGKDSMNRKMKVYLLKEGFRPEVSEDGKDLYFKREGLNYIYFGHDEDERFFSIALPGIFDVTPESKSAVLEVANQINLRMRVGKVVVTDENVWCVYERFLTSQESLEEICPRAFDVLAGARQEFYKYLEDLNK